VVEDVATRKHFASAWREGVYPFDPELDYLTPPLQGYRLIKGVYMRSNPMRKAACTARR